jgi:hypothetical protein
MTTKRRPRAGRNLGRFRDGQTVYRVRSVNQQLQFRPLHGRKRSIIRVSLPDVLRHFAAAVAVTEGSLFGVERAGQPPVMFRAWVQDGELRFSSVSGQQTGVLTLPLTAALELASRQLFLPSGPSGPPNGQLPTQHQGLDEEW